MGILAQVGAGNSDFIKSVSTFLDGISFNSGLTEQTEVGEYNEKWTTGFVSGWLFGYEWPSISTPLAAGEQNEREFSFVAKMKSEPTTGSDHFFLGALTQIGINLRTINKEMVVEYWSNGVLTSIPTGIIFRDELKVPVVVRLRGQSGQVGGVSPTDGAYEVWVNGDMLVASGSNLDWIPTSSSTDLQRKELRNGQDWTLTDGLGSHIYRDFVIRDDWSSADGVAPGIPHVIDRGVTVATVKSGTWEDAAAGPVDAADLNDQNNSTVVRTTDTSAELVLTMDPLDAAVQAFPKVVTTLGIQAGRDALDPNSIDVVEVDDAVGTNEIGTATTIPVLAANPNREEILTTINGASNDLYVKIRNGV